MRLMRFPATALCRAWNCSIPVATIGGLNDPAQMEEIIASGKADVVYMARALLADPFLPRKVMENRSEDIVHCLRCFTCMAERAATGTRRCTVNPLIGREMEGDEVQPAPVKKKVLIAGGGPGGLYAAWTAARRGHSVVLCEKEVALGGILKSEIALPFKREMFALTETYERFDFLAETAEGMYMYDENGTPYLDFYAGIAVNNAGNRNPKVVAAAKEQLDDIMHTFNYPYTIPQALLAEKVCETIGMDKIFYQNSGTEANEAMIKMARKYGIEKYGPNRYHIVTAKMGFHGRTFGAMSATGQPGNGCQVGFGPMTYGFSYAPYNDLQAFKDACTENTIAIMVEPVQGEGGVHPATKEFMQGLRKFCDENDMLLLIDEVQTGWCRTGAVMSYMNYGIKPDIVSMAKGLGGGMPIGAICATAEVAKAFTPGSHGTTFGGHPVSCAAALAEVNELIDRDLAGNAKKVGDYFAEKLAKLPHVKEVRHQGLLVGVEFDDTISGVEVKHGCLDRHLLITAIGAHIIRLIPPLIVTEEDCDKAVAIIEETVKALEK
jgi:acetylornithine/N-succinyldiaminopimelate aminotransferase